MSCTSASRSIVYGYVLGNMSYLVWSTAKLATGAAVVHLSPLSVPRISSNTTALAVFGGKWPPRLTSSIGKCGERGKRGS
ncbi:hypothetical protein HBI56_118290 [Parastagonospora nodorum]|uniref:Uncharacterized protein n=1 Tax=Phaeosphaeria nodorum (strain SN15 / ATCC MYA-4574 / FGSC 10173) TaxID=321614 RepID=A0A7U2I5E7_PHANO|nr:hypothetical protein HBH56_056480 [Parastagonospora nodorum]QRD02480.1 hypothetical protein JI435_418070 [Parastagonospora nodorum SN15]KAH3921113.1 hypothetical protein HBH54_245770 [Parastagonospora nodorum]KAH3956410.1 hypothetical protein HBH51_242170 [Parastagonospora nodorum]KAH3988765.1 hypothetical protein HBH52_030890 [Parastagonospora nodorum]